MCLPEGEKGVELARKILRHALADAGFKFGQAEALLFAIENLIAIMIATDDKGR